MYYVLIFYRFLWKWRNLSGTVFDNFFIIFFNTFTLHLGPFLCCFVPPLFLILEAIVTMWPSASCCIGISCKTLGYLAAWFPNTYWGLAGCPRTRGHIHQQSATLGAILNRSSQKQFHFYSVGHTSRKVFFPRLCLCCHFFCADYFSASVM